MLLPFMLIRSLENSSLLLNNKESKNKACAVVTDYMLGEFQF